MPLGTPVTLSLTFDTDTATNRFVCTPNGAGSYSMQMSATVTFPNFVIPYSGGLVFVDIPGGKHLSAIWHRDGAVGPL